MKLLIRLDGELSFLQQLPTKFRNIVHTIRKAGKYRSFSEMCDLHSSIRSLYKKKKKKRFWRIIKSWTIFNVAIKFKGRKYYTTKIFCATYCGCVCILSVYRGIDLLKEIKQHKVFLKIENSPRNCYLSSSHNFAANTTTHNNCVHIIRPFVVCYWCFRQS